MTKINFSFENYNLDQGDSIENFLMCGQKKIGNFLEHNSNLFSNATKFTFSPLAESFFNFYRNNPDSSIVPVPFNVSDIFEKYIISVGVHHHPCDWAGREYHNNKETPTLFELLNSKYLNDLRNRKALLLIDQSFEGYQTEWLWKFFHEECEKHKIDPSVIVYVTGNQLAQEQYDKWYVKHKNNHEKLKIISSIVLIKILLWSYNTQKLKTNFDFLLNYKKENLDKIKLFDCINKRHRLHRVYNYLFLHRYKLIEDGMISMDKIDQSSVNLFEMQKYGLSLNLLTEANKNLPKWIGEPNTVRDFFFYESRILNDLYANTWVSLVAESSYFAYENSVFISEKTFKPMLCMQPFIICGSKGVLKKLRNLGFKTFEGFIDESYDELDDFNRFIRIAQILKQIKAIPDKISWYKKMRPILEHNFNLCMSYNKNLMPEQQTLVSIVEDHFKNV